MKIDAENLVAGRFATVAAKNALLGEEVEIINCSKAVISGSRKEIFADYMRKQKMGTHRKGPFYFRQPDRFVKRLIRGMLPHRQEKGRLALSRIKCFSGIPESVEREDFKSLDSANVKKLRSTDFVYVEDICRIMGGK
jgi:large subunit ribosomal protein L13